MIGSPRVICLQLVMNVHVNSFECRCSHGLTSSLQIRLPTETRTSETTSGKQKVELIILARLDCLYIALKKHYLFFLAVEKRLKKWHNQPATCPSRYRSFSVLKRDDRLESVKRRQTLAIKKKGTAKNDFGPILKLKSWRRACIKHDKDSSMCNKLCCCALSSGENYGQSLIGCPPRPDRMQLMHFVVLRQ